MGKNNGVRLWVHGDGSGAVLRVRVLQTGGASSPGDVAAVRPVWVSDPVSLSFSGWREIVLPKSKFTLRAPDASVANLDLALPPDAQVGTAAGAAVTPDWSAVDAVALETFVPRRSLVLVDDIAWVTLDANNAVTSEASVDDFEKGNVAAWVSGGTHDQQQALVYGLGTQPGQAHGGRVGFKLEVTAPASLRQTTLLPNVKRLLTQSAKTYLVYTPPNLFETILPSSLPQPGTITPDLSVTACPDQIQAATFCLYSQKALKDVTVTLPKDLQGLGRTLPRSSVDVRVVKVWPRQGAGPLRDADAAAPMPELLVKDDRVPFSGPCPVVRLTGSPVTDIPADTVKQFWITVSVPRNTVAGHYIGNFLVSGKGLTAPVPVRMDLNVLPLRLLNPAKQYAINLRSRLDPAPSPLPSADGRALATDFVSKDILDVQLADIAAHGFRYVTLYDSPTTLADAVAERKRLGFGEPFVYRGDAPTDAVEAARKAAGLSPFVYYQDPTPLADTQTRVAALSKAGINTAAYIGGAEGVKALQDSVSLALDNRDMPYAQDLIRTKGKRTFQTRDWWYWPAATEAPHTNRLDAGYLLWRANLYGAFVPEYQAAFGTDPYDESGAGASPLLSAFRPQMLTYPVQGGVLDTLQWEALREGVNDVRYLTTMFLALGDCRHVYNIAKPLTDTAETYINTFLDKPLALLTDGDYDKARAQIAQYAVQLNAQIAAYKKKNKIAP